MSLIYRNSNARDGRINITNVIGFSLFLMLVLVFLVNTLTAILNVISLIGYAIIYTAYLKRMTPQNIVIGEVHPYALLLSLIIFVWTPPHFWHEYPAAIPAK